MVIKDVEQHWLDDLKQRSKIYDDHRNQLEEAKKNEISVKGLDSALKKTTAFMKKLKTLSTPVVPSLIDDLSKVNLSKFIEEMSQAIAETKIKNSEVPSVTQLCVAICCRYASFSELLLAEMKKNLPQKKSDKIANSAKLKIDLRFLAECILCGVFSREGMQVLGSALAYLCLMDKTEFNNVPLISFMCRSIGWHIARIVPKPADSNAETASVSTDDLPMNPQFSESDIKHVSDLFNNYFDALVKTMEKACVKMNKAHKIVKRQQRVRGDAGDEEKIAFEEAKTEYEKFKAQMAELAGAMGQDIVQMNEEPSEDEDTECANLEFSRALKEGGLSIWPDDEAKVFYENLLDIRAIVPKNLYKESEVRTVPTEKMQDSVDAIDVDSVLSTSQQDVQPQDSSNFPSSSRENSPTPTSQIHEVVVDPSSFGTEEMKAKWQKFTLDLDHLVNKELADQAALFFVSNLNTKAYRKRLVKALLGVESSRMDILPFYARLICSLNNVMPDVTTEVINQLIQQFREFIQPIRKEFVRVEEKIKCCIFITELMKFGIIPRAEGLSCLRQLVYYFHGHLIDMAAAMIENGGMYMYRSTDCHSKMKQLLEVVQTKKERLKDERQIVLIETAYFACIPPEDGRRYKAKELPPMQLYIRNLILSINSKSVNETIQCLRKIDWVDPKVRGWAMYYLSSPWLLPYSQLHNLANAVSGLNAIQYHDWIGVQIIDNITETIRMSLEVPMVFNQFAVASVKYLGELYNYTVCENPIIFTTLYNLISFDIEQDIQSADFFRLHLTCELVVTVGDYFQKGHSKMDYFITYFQRYYWMKRNTWLQNAPMSEDMEQPT
ncbi:hypothetical protein WR25_12955 [Diploscapter pachys]|uniref:MIF4G domain-containing protein n=1 Tax=Diploscapter pachys TaxID=2018661 RepID=A0A2A2K2Z2_9BILA|nr:hypothetical protein WR25_12955 [Diploscapter pachys]